MPYFDVVVTVCGPEGDPDDWFDGVVYIDHDNAPTDTELTLAARDEYGNTVYSAERIYLADTNNLGTAHPNYDSMAD